MKNNKFKNIIIVVIFMIIGFIIGYFLNNFINKESKDNIINIPVTDISYIEDIKESEYNNDVVEGYVNELQTLTQRMNELNDEKQDIESKILNLKQKLNNSTNFIFEKQIYPEKMDNK